MPIHTRDGVMRNGRIVAAMVACTRAHYDYGNTEEGGWPKGLPTSWVVSQILILL